MTSISGALRNSTNQNNSTSSGSISSALKSAHSGYSASIPDTTNQPTLGGQIIRGLLRFPVRVANTIAEPIEKATGTYPGSDSENNGYLGDISGFGMKDGQTTAQRLKDIGGGLLEGAAYLIPGLGETAGAEEGIAEQVAKSTTQKVLSGAKEGAIVGATGGAGNELDTNPNATLGSTLKSALIGGAVGGGIGGILGRFGKNPVSNISKSAEEDSSTIAGKENIPSEIPPEEPPKLNSIDHNSIMDAYKNGDIDTQQLRSVLDEGLGLKNADVIAQDAETLKNEGGNPDATWLKSAIEHYEPSESTPKDTAPKESDSNDVSSNIEETKDDVTNDEVNEAKKTYSGEYGDGLADRFTNKTWKFNIAAAKTIPYDVQKEIAAGRLAPPEGVDATFIWGEVKKRAELEDDGETQADINNSKASPSQQGSSLQFSKNAQSKNPFQRAYDAIKEKRGKFVTKNDLKSFAKKVDDAIRESKNITRKGVIDLLDNTKCIE